VHIQQLKKRILGILILRPVRNIIPRQQDLCNWLIEMSEQLVPQTHQPALSNSCQCLHFGKMFGSFLNVHSAQSNADGARRDKDDSMSILV
jgi:hypothetical protein